MIRFASDALDNWLKSTKRKPLVIRGARQVGKTWLVRDLAKRHGLQLIELNFERFPNLADLFSGNRPSETLQNIEAELGMTIRWETALLFLDEIQAAPELFAKLRWFMEELPELPIIAAGSLLEFALMKKSSFSMPVGRITYHYLNPMSFFEFVLASGNEPLYRKLSSSDIIKSPLPQTLHEKCLKLYRDYCIIGGMPEVVREWTEHNNLKSCIKLQHDLLATFRDDFHKYGGEADARLLANILLSVSKQLGNKFVYSHVDPSVQLPVIKKALDLLSLARVCIKILHTSGNGLPLGAESNEKFFKALLLDIGLISVQLGMSSMSRTNLEGILLTNMGGIAEQFVGQQLMAAQTPLTDPQLYYWQRIGGRLGEIDYIIQSGNRIVPVEVKSGPSGRMKSLHQFMAEKGHDIAVRLNPNLPVTEDIQVKTTLGEPVTYRMISLPLYLAELVYKILDEAF